MPHGRNKREERQSKRNVDRWRGRVGGTERGLINETYAAAADTKMHCKYTTPEKLLSPNEIYTCPNYTRVGPSNFFRSSNNSLSAPFLHEPRLDNVQGPIDRYRPAHVGQQMSGPGDS